MREDKNGDESIRETWGGKMTRREFLRLSSGLVVAIAVGREAGESLAGIAPSSPETVWLRVGREGKVTVYAPTPEGGQGIRTELAQLAAEELMLPLSSVEVILGDTDLVPASPVDCPSLALPAVALAVRRAAIQAREEIAQRGALLEGRGHGVDARHWEEEGVSIPPERWRVINQSVPRLEGPDYVAGRAKYVGDLRPDGLTYGVVIPPLCLGARLVEADTRVAAGQPGVLAVVHEGDFIGVVGRSQEAAERGAMSVRARWEEPRYTAAPLYTILRETARLEEEVGRQGDVEAEMAHAPQGYSAAYRIPYSAHASLEPQVAIAESRGGRLLVYANTLWPFEHRAAVARALGLMVSQVGVRANLVGGALGGKEGADVSVQAARLARVVNRPVLVRRTREEEMTLNAFRPAALIELNCGVTEDGRLTAWSAEVYNCGSSGAIPPYRVGARRIRSYRCSGPLPHGPWIGMGSAANVFSREVHIDHIAAERGEDPIVLRERHLEGEPRLRAVVRAAAERYGWSNRRPPTGLGVGFACALEAGSCAAVIAEVMVERITGIVRVRRVLVAQESGLVVNPGVLKRRVEGVVVMGIGFAMMEVVRYEQGRVLTHNFGLYRIPGFEDTPDIDIVFVDGKEEAPRCGTAAVLGATGPAIANAVFDATGVRVRELPISGAAALRG